MGSPITNPLQQAQWRLFNPSQNPFGSPDASQAPTPAAATAPGSGTPSPSPTPSPASDGPSTLFGTSAAQSSSTPSPTSTAPADSGQVHPASSALFGQQAPAQSLDDFIQQHGHAPIAAPPPAVPQHGMLYKIFNGIGRYLGNPMAEQAEQRDWNLKQQGIQYQRDQPVMQRQADEQAYNESLGQGERIAQTEGAQAQTSKTWQEIHNMQVNPPGKEEFLQKFSAAIKSGEEDPQQVLSQYLALSHNVPGVARADLVNIANSTPIDPPQFKIGAQGIREPLRYQGRNWYGDEPNAPPEVQQAAKNAQRVETQVHSNKLQEQAAAKSNIVLGHEMTEQSQLDFEKQRQVDAIKKEAQEADESYNAIIRLSKDNTGASDNALIDQFYNIAKPTSGARMNEAQQQRLQKFGSLVTRVQQWGNEVANGGRLLPEQRQEIINAAKDLHDTKMEAVNNNLFYLKPGEKAVGNPPENAPAAPPQGGGAQNKTPPKGATHTGVGSVDKKTHYLDAQGNDLGLAE